MKRLTLFSSLPLMLVFVNGARAQDQIFQDVPPGVPYLSQVNQMYLRGITAGCGTQPLVYCGTSGLSRETMAALMIRAVYSAKTGDGENFTYTQTPWFNDVPPSNPYFKYIQAMKDLGITSGCSTNYYCPSDNATNGQFAVFTVKAYQIAHNQTVGYPLPGCGYSCTSYEYFSNEPSIAPVTYAQFHDYIQSARILIGADITSQCGLGPGYFCTDYAANRIQAAYNIVEGIWNGLTLPANTRVNFDMVTPAVSGSTLTYGSSNSALFKFTSTLYPVTVSAGYSGPGSTDAFSPQAIPGTVGFNSIVIMSNLAAYYVHPTLYVRLSAGGVVKDYSYTTATGISTTGLSNPTWLEANLSYMSFSTYDNAHMASSDAGLAQSCPTPGTTSIRSCFQTILHNLRAQGVSGVRIYISYCSGNGGPLTGCGGQVSWNPNADPARTWIAHAGDFFQDVHDAGIQNVTISSDLGNGGGGTFTLPVSNTTSPNGSGDQNVCVDPDMNFNTSNVMFYATVPFALRPPGLPNGNPGFPIGQGRNGAYNCVSINPYFIGWSNYFNVVDAVLGAAQGKVTVSELDAQQEIDMLGFTAELRYIYDNSNPAQVVDVLYNLRNLMIAHGFLASRVTWSAPWEDSTPIQPQYQQYCNNVDHMDTQTSTCNCTNVYQGYARLFHLDAIYSAIGGGYIGVNDDADQNTDHTGGLTCGGTNYLSMFRVPYYGDAQPGIVDSHMYPSTLQGTGDQYIQHAATVDYSDLAHFMTLPGLQSALVTIGETHMGWTPPYAGYDALGNPCNNAPSSAASSNVAGFNQSALAGNYSVVFRPWMNISGLCFPYGPSTYQNENYNWNGPYVFDRLKRF